MKQIGWCRIKQEVVTDQDLLSHPFLQDDIVVYRELNGSWRVWEPEIQGFRYIALNEVPEIIQMGMMML